MFLGSLLYSSMSALTNSSLSRISTTNLFISSRISLIFSIFHLTSSLRCVTDSLCSRSLSMSGTRCLSHSAASSTRRRAEAAESLRSSMRELSLSLSSPIVLCLILYSSMSASAVCPSVMSLSSSCRRLAVLVSDSLSSLLIAALARAICSRRAAISDSRAEMASASLASLAASRAALASASRAALAAARSSRDMRAISSRDRPPPTPSSSASSWVKCAARENAVMYARSSPLADSSPRSSMRLGRPPAPPAVPDLPPPPTRKASPTLRMNAARLAFFTSAAVLPCSTSAFHSASCSRASTKAFALRSNREGATSCTFGGCSVTRGRRDLM
mmetsp:Transcript_70675/g.166639  ORF Transcript_70675/g.166639 Transcript_70675/m.166639 type:complete len:331 (-) Transcript_70675:583-1575(-)